MDHLSRFFIIFLKINFLLDNVNSEIYTVKVGTETHVNEVDPRFLSFTIDPKYLFSSDEKYNSKECVCMATSLTPAFIRIAGPSTRHMTFENTSITIHPDRDLDLGRPRTEQEKEHLENHFKLGDLLFPNRAKGLQRRAILTKRESGHTLSVSHEKWKKFIDWSNNTGFDIVFALNNQEKLNSGIWDPNAALNILSVADSANIENIVWQLGYECSNQSIEEYLYDLETLRVMLETFPRGQSRHWKVVGGDVTPCLHGDSKSDFKDFVTLSDDRLDAILLDGNSSIHELEKMSERDRLKLLRLLSHSHTPLWISEHHTMTSHVATTSELLRAADWMSSLGHSARNGFAVHFRELRGDELHQPSLSFYMALLFKNLVGERVLNAEVDSPSERTFLFAHCTSLRHKPVPGAITLFGANMDDEPARFSLKLSKREEGGDIMQFILGLDNSGNIIVNGKAMYYEGDIRPVVKRVRPYKTLLINLPPKSFGFWVLANTKVEACYATDATEDSQFVKAISVAEDKADEKVLVRNKRKSNSIESPDFVDLDEIDISDDVKERNNGRSKVLKNVHTIPGWRAKRTERIAKNDDKCEGINRIKRQTYRNFKEKYSSNEILKRKPKRTVLKTKDRKVLKAMKDEEEKPKAGLFGRLIRLNAKLNETRRVINERTKRLRLGKQQKNKVSKRNSGKKPKTEKNDQSEVLHKIREENKDINNDNLKPSYGEETKIKESEESNKSNRTRRSIIREKRKKLNIKDTENEIDVDDSENTKFGKMLHKINKQLSDLPNKLEPATNNKDQTDENDSEAIEDQLILKTKITDDDAFIKLSEKSNNGLFRSSFDKVLSVLEDFNNKLNRIMQALTVLEL